MRSREEKNDPGPRWDLAPSRRESAQVVAIVKGEVSEKRHRNLGSFSTRAEKTDKKNSDFLGWKDKNQISLSSTAKVREKSKS